MTYTALDRYCLITRQAHGEVIPEERQSDYQAGIAEIDGHLWRIRTASTTPTKSGGFVAIWHRDETGKTAPFTSDTELHDALVFIEQSERFGVFSFTRQHLEQLGAYASATAPGKRGFRVYPSWVTGLHVQAKKSQDAQRPAFSVLVD